MEKECLKKHMYVLLLWQLRSLHYSKLSLVVVLEASRRYMMPFSLGAFWYSTIGSGA